MTNSTNNWEHLVLEHQLAAEYTWWFLLFALTGSVLLAGQRALQLVPGWPFRPRIEWLNALLVTVIVSVLVVDGLSLVRVPHLAWNAVVRIGIVTLTMFLIWFQVRLATRRYLMETRWRQMSRATLLITSLLIAAWSAHRYYTTVAPVIAPEPPLAELPGHHVPSKRYVAVTDSGREIPLYRWQAEGNNDRKMIESITTLLMGRFPSVIQREEPDERSNCHGWVFTSGRFLLTGNDVDQILKDNEYEQVQMPQVGDVIIYRNADGGIVHTGLVVGILADKSVMIESKWSVGARYLHRPEGQPYSANFSYYRTTRPSHSIAIRFQNRTQIVEGEQPIPPRDEKPPTVPKPKKLHTKSVPTAA